MSESIERMRKLVNDNLVMGLRFQMNGELNKLESEIEQELKELRREGDRLMANRKKGKAWTCPHCMNRFLVSYQKAYEYEYQKIAHGNWTYLDAKFCPYCGERVGE